MYKHIVIIGFLALSACRPKAQVDFYPGPDGKNGVGQNGTPGPQGNPGQGANIGHHNLNGSCEAIGDGYYAKYQSATVKIYNSSCSGNSFNMNDASSTFWISSTSLAVFISPNGLRVITFN